jgi:hypothetical protein
MKRLHVHIQNFRGSGFFLYIVTPFLCLYRTHSLTLSLCLLNKQTNALFSKQDPRAPSDTKRVATPTRRPKPTTKAARPPKQTSHISQAFHHISHHRSRISSPSQPISHQSMLPPTLPPKQQQGRRSESISRWCCACTCLHLQWQTTVSVGFVCVTKIH